MKAQPLLVFTLGTTLLKLQLESILGKSFIIIIITIIIIEYKQQIANQL